MQKYSITIKHTTTSDLSIEANSRREAEDIAMRIAKRRNPDAQWHKIRHDDNTVADAGR